MTNNINFCNTVSGLSGSENAQDNRMEFIKLEWNTSTLESSFSLFNFCMLLLLVFAFIVKLSLV